MAAPQGWKQQLLTVLRSKGQLSLSNLKAEVPGFPLQDTPEGKKGVKGVLKSHEEFIVEQVKSDWIVMLSGKNTITETTNWKSHLLALLRSKGKLSLSRFRKEIPGFPFKDSVKAVLQSHKEFIVEQVQSDWIVKLADEGAVMPPPQPSLATTDATASDAPLAIVSQTEPDLVPDLNQALRALCGFICEQPKRKIRIEQLSAFYKKFPEHKETLKPHRKASAKSLIKKAPSFHISNDGYISIREEDDANEVHPARSAESKKPIPQPKKKDNESLNLGSAQVAAQEESGKKKKKRPRRKKSTNSDTTGDTTSSNSNSISFDWDSTPNVSESDIEALQKSDLGINDWPSAVKDIKDSSVRSKLLMLKNNLTSKQFNAVFTEAKKGFAYQRVDHLWKPEGQDEKQRLLDSGQDLKSMADEMRTTTTQLAYALCGKNVIKTELAHKGMEITRMSDENGDQRKIELAQEAIDKMGDDKLTGNTLGSFDHDPLEHLKRTVGRPGEVHVKKLLDEKKIQYKTEAQQNNDSKQNGEEASEDQQEQKEEQGSVNTTSSSSSSSFSLPSSSGTPDFLLDKTEVIHEREVKWIEVKHAVCIPGVSPDDYVNRVKWQVSRYCDEFGPGILIFTKGVVPANLQAALPEGVFVMRCKNVPEEKNERKKQGRSQQGHSRHQRGRVHPSTQTGRGHPSTQTGRGHPSTQTGRGFPVHPFNGPTLVYETYGMPFGSSPGPMAKQALHHSGNITGLAQEEYNNDTTFVFNSNLTARSSGQDDAKSFSSAPSSAKTAQENLIRIKVEVTPNYPQTSHKNCTFSFPKEATLNDLISHIEQEMRPGPKSILYRLSTMNGNTTKDDHSQRLKNSDRDKTLLSLGLHRSKITQTCFKSGLGDDGCAPAAEEKKEEEKEESEKEDMGFSLFD